MPRKKIDSEAEINRLTDEVKRLKAANRNLRKRLKEHEKRQHFYEKSIDSDDAEETKNKVTDNDRCPSCGKGEMIEVDLKHIIIARCNIEACGYSERRKPVVGKEKKKTVKKTTK